MSTRASKRKEEKRDRNEQGKRGRREDANWNFLNLLLRFRQYLYQKF